MRKIKVSVLLRYYNCVCRKLNKARATLNEKEIERLKEIKMKLLFLESPIYKDYSKYDTYTLIEL